MSKGHFWQLIWTILPNNPLSLFALMNNRICGRKFIHISI